MKEVTLVAAIVKDFTPDIIEMVLVAGIPAVLMIALRMSRQGVRKTLRLRTKAQRHTPEFSPDLENESQQLYPKEL